MPRPAVPLDPERLLQEDPFVRGLSRQLLRDDDRADDLAQTTWLELLRKPLSAETPRTLLATIVRRLAHKQKRGEQRTERRERAQPPAEPVPSPREILEREETRSRVVRAVLALPVEMRDVVVLRFFENLPPRAIAKRLSIPVETVRTRHKRAIARLREELDATTDGGRAAWSAALLPFATPVAHGAATAALLGGLFMAAKGKAAAIAAMCVVAFGCWWMFASDEPSAATAEAQGHERAAVAGPGGEVARAREAGATDENAPARVEAAAQRTTGDVVVRVVMAHGANAIAKPGVAVQLLELGRRHAAPQELVTDEAGRAMFRDLAPARYELELPGRSWGPERVVFGVRAGETAEHTLQLSRGIALRGVVVDTNGAPLADAEVVVADWSGERNWVLGRTGVDGRFALDAVRRDVHVGARCRGFVPSNLQQVSAEHGATVELRIELARGGASLRGVVRDERGDPVSGAVVTVGSRVQDFRARSDGCRDMAPRPVKTNSDADGRYVVSDLQPGELPVLVAKEGRSPNATTVALRAGEESQHDVMLLAEAVLVGSLRDAKGAPCTGVLVTAGEWNDPDRAEGATDELGAFVLHEMPLREVAVDAVAGDGRKVQSTFHLRAGERLRWDAVLDAPAAIHGRLLDAEGEPIAQLFVAARSDDFRWQQNVRTDEQGAFKVQGFPADTRVEVRPRRFSIFPEAVFSGLVPRADEYVLRMPERREVHLLGRVRLPDGSVPQNLSLMPVWAAGGEGSPVEHADPATGTFRLGPYPPGEFQLIVECQGYARLVLPRQRIDADHDYGTLQLEVGGTAQIRLLWPEAGAMPAYWARVSTRDGTGVHVQQGSRSTLTTSSLPAGDYVLQLGGEGLVNQQVPFAIASGLETVLDLHVRTGVRVALQLALPDGANGDTRVEVFAEDGRAVLHDHVWPRRAKGSTTAMLLPGRYRVKAQHGALVAERQFDLAAGAAAVWELVLR